MEEELVELPEAHGVNRWYFFVPPVLLGIWLLGVVTWGVLSLIAPEAEREVRLMSAAHPTGAVHLVLELVDWLGILGWISLFFFYFALVSRKQLSGWWALGGLCLGLNLPLYVLLLLRPPRWHARPPLAPLQLPLGWEERSRAAALLKGSFACDFCDALLNHGVSECSECGERYRYEGGKPVAVARDRSRPR